MTLAGWTLLVFSLGIAAGALIRRALPAMAAAGALGTVLVGLTYWKLHSVLLNQGATVSPGAVQVEQPFTFSNPNGTVLPGGGVALSPAGSWTLATWFTDRTGHRLAGTALNPMYGLKVTAQQAWLTSHHDTLWMAYQPADRFWVLQGIEGGTMLILALLLGAATIWLVRLRRA